MPIKTTIVSRSFKNQFTNGVDYNLDTSNDTDNLAGSVVEFIQATHQVEITWIAKGSQSDIFTLSQTGLTRKVKRSTGDFRDDGFWEGQVVQYGYGRVEAPTDRSGNIAIATISEDGKEIVFVDQNPPTEFYIEVNDGFVVPSTGQNAFSSLIYGFGLIGEDENYNTRSKITNNPQGFYFRDIDAIGVSGIAKGTYNDWATGATTCKSVATAKEYTQVFEITHNFRGNPFYTDGEIDNITNNILPDLFKGKSLKYAFDVEFRIALSDPNKAVKSTFDKIKGSVGWYNQNFNGFDNDYSIDSIIYEDVATTDAVDGLQISSRTKTTITVSKLSGAMVATQRAGVFVAYLAGQSEYQDTTTTQGENFLFSSIYHNEGDAPEVSTGIIKSMDSSIVSGNLVIELEFEYTTPQQLRLTTESNYLICVHIADSAISAGDSDRVTLVADVNTYQKGAFIEGLFDVTDFGYLVNGQSIADTAFLSIAEIWNEDSIAVKGSFDLDLAKEAFLERIEFALVAFNTVTSSYFLLDSFFLNTSNFTVSGGSQQIAINQSRGYTQAYESETFNQINITIGAKVGDLQGYDFNFAQKLKWQDWINNPNADTVFYNASEPQNNLNFKSSNYSGLENYEIQMIVIASTTGIDDLGRAGIGLDTYFGGNITVKDYGFSDTAYTVAEVSTFDPDTLVDLGGSVLSDKPTLLESRFSGTSTNNAVILHRYEKTNQLGAVIPEIEASLSIDGTEIVGSTLLDSSLFSQGESYNFTARLFNPFLVFTFQTENTTMNAGFTASASTQIDWIFGIDTVETFTPSYAPNFSGAYLDGTRKAVIVTTPDFSLITALNFNFNPWIYGDIDLSVFSDNVDFNLQSNLIENIAFRDGQIVGGLNLVSNTTLTERNFSSVLFDGFLFFTDNGVTPYTFSTAYGLNQISNLRYVGYTTSNNDLDFTNVEFTGQVGLAVDCGTGSILFYTGGNTITQFNGQFIGTARSILLDFTNVICPDFNIPFQYTTTTIVTFSTTVNSLTRFVNANGGAKLFVFNSTVIDTNTTSFDIRNHSMDLTEIDNFYIALHGAWINGGSTSLASLVVESSGNTAPSATSFTERDAMATAGATINT